jgi:hypothetical protein
MLSISYFDVTSVETKNTGYAFFTTFITFHIFVTEETCFINLKLLLYLTRCNMAHGIGKVGHIGDPI